MMRRRVVVENEYLRITMVADNRICVLYVGDILNYKDFNGIRVWLSVVVRNCLL